MTSGERLTMAPNEEIAERGLVDHIDRHACGARERGKGGGFAVVLERADRERGVGEVGSFDVAAVNGDARLRGDLDHLVARRRRRRRQPTRPRRQATLPSRRRPRCRPRSRRACRRARRTPAGARAAPCAACAFQRACAWSCTILFSSGRHEPQLVPARSALPIASTFVAAFDAIASRITVSPTPKQAQMTGPISARPSAARPGKQYAASACRRARPLRTRL